MGDIDATIFSFEYACQRLSRPEPEYISKMLERERVACETSVNWSMHLYLAGNHPELTTERITDSDCEILQKAFEYNHYIRSIDLRYNVITDKGAIAIAKLLTENTYIKEINLMVNDFGEKGGVALAKSLHENTDLKVLRLNGCKIGYKGGLAFAEALAKNETLLSLDIGETDQTMQSLIAIATVLRDNDTLKALTINRPLLWTVQEEPTDHFARMIKVNKGLEELHMTKFNMKDFGVWRLAENLKFNFTLTYLNLNCNKITRDGAKELADLLKLNTCLKTLELGSNQIKDDGAIFLAEALKLYNTTLECLNITHNNIKPKGLCAVADALNFNSALESLYIWGNYFDDNVNVAFAEHLHTERLKKDDCDILSYVVDGKLFLAQGHHLKRQRFYYNAPIRGEDVPEWQIKGKSFQREGYERVQIMDSIDEAKKA